MHSVRWLVGRGGKKSLEVCSSEFIGHTDVDATDPNLLLASIVRMVGRCVWIEASSRKNCSLSCCGWRSLGACVLRIARVKCGVVRMVCRIRGVE